MTSIVLNPGNWLAENAVLLAPVALVFYDYLLTLDREVKYVWREKVSVGAVLFYITRYSLVFVMILQVLEYYPTNVLSCSIYERMSSIIGSVCYLSSCAIFASLRTWAICDRSWPTFIVVLVLGLAYPTITLYTLMENIPLEINELPTLPVDICGGASQLGMIAFENYIIAARICAIAAETLILAISYSKTHQLRKESSGINKASPILSVVYVDGGIYFGVLLISNIVLLAVVRISLGLEAGLEWVDTLTGILTCRFMLDLREAASGGDGYTVSLKTIVFRNSDASSIDAEENDLDMQKSNTVIQETDLESQTNDLGTRGNHPDMQENDPKVQNDNPGTSNVHSDTAHAS